MTESTSLGSEGFDELLGRARQAMESVRAGTDPTAEPLEAVGTAGDGKVRVTVRSPGRVSALELDPRMMRLGSEELAQHLVTAVNAALDELRARTVDTVAPVDLNSLNSQLADLHNESVRQMERFTSAIGAAVAQIRR